MLIERFKENPLITPEDVPPSRPDLEVVCAFNAGATIYNDQVLLLLRVAERPKQKSPDEETAPIYNPETSNIDYLKVKHTDPELEIVDSRVFRYKQNTYLTSLSHLRIARSKNGRDFVIDAQPAVFPCEDYETFGLEDPHITKFDDEYLITYKAVSKYGICTALLKTKDFQTFQRQGIIFCPENLDVIIFPEKINGQFYTFTRPVPKHIGPLAIWLATSPDAIHWGQNKMLLAPREGKFDSGRVGASCVPIKTDHGWLEIYHGADQNQKYCLAAVLLDSNDPSKIIARSDEPIIQPEADYEVTGFFGNVIFSCGAVTDANGLITIYYGAADKVTAAATTTIDKIINHLK